MHGYLADSNSFVYQKRFFEREFDVYAIDFKGFGKNAGMEYPYSLDDYKAQLLKFMVDNNITYPHVLAHSFGARVLLKTAYENPRIFDKLVLTGAAGLRPKKTLKKTLKKCVFKILKLVFPKRKLTRFYSKDYLQLSPVMKKSFVKIVSEHLDYTLDKIDNQTLLVFGKNDKETPLYMAKRFNKKLKNSRLEIFSNAGHFPFIDKSIKFNYIMREFLLSKD